MSLTVRIAAQKLAQTVGRLKHLDPRSPIAWQLSIALKELEEACQEEDKAAERTEEERIKACAVLEKAQKDLLTVAKMKGGIS